MVLIDSEQQVFINQDPSVFTSEVGVPEKPASIDDFPQRFIRVTFLALTWNEGEPKGLLVLANDKKKMLDGKADLLRPKRFRRFAYASLEVGMDHAKIWVEQGDTRAEFMIERNMEFPTSTFLKYERRRWTPVEKEGFGRIEWSDFDKVLDWVERNNKMGGVTLPTAPDPSPEGKPLARVGS